MTVFAVPFIAVTTMLWLGSGTVPWWFRLIFTVCSASLAVAAVLAWSQRIRGGSAILHLSEDPAPHGMPVVATFLLGRPVVSEQWWALAEIDASLKHQTGFGGVWSQRFEAAQVTEDHVRCEFTLPADQPSTAASDNETTWRVTLTLHAQGTQWPFELQTRATVAPDPSPSRPGARPPPDAGELRRGRGRLAWVSIGVFVLVVGWHSWTLFADEASAAETSFNSAPFELRISDWGNSAWAVETDLVGQAQVRRGVLVVDISRLALRASGHCEAKPHLCELTSVSLLLTQDQGAHFKTLATGVPITIARRMNVREEWHLAADAPQRQLTLQLPPGADRKGAQLRLAVELGNGASVHPQAQPALLERALAKPFFGR